MTSRISVAIPVLNGAPPQEHRRTSAPPVRVTTLPKGTIMNTVTSVPRRILSVLAIVAFHLLAALFVLLYVFTTGAVALVRWCVAVVRRSVRRPRRAAVRAS